MDYPENSVIADNRVPPILAVRQLVAEDLPCRVCRAIC